MMKDKKTVFRYYTIFDCEKEEEFLSSMSEKGWEFTHAHCPGLYHFRKCEPAKVTYRLDYNREGARDRREYIGLFTDCGWEYICDFFGFSYFRTTAESGAQTEIFCDEASRFDMLKRVFRGRVIPLIIIFALILIPQLLMYTEGSKGSLRDTVLYCFLGLAALYLAAFTRTAVSFYKAEKRLKEGGPGFIAKYVALFGLIAAIIASIVFVFWHSYRSVYEVKDLGSGYSVEAELLNTSVTREYDLKEGDIAEFRITGLKKGCFHLSLTKEGEEPFFYGDYFSTVSHKETVKSDGRYILEIAGNKAEGSASVTIR